MALTPEGMEAAIDTREHLKKLVNSLFMNCQAGTYDRHLEIAEAISEAVNDLQPSSDGNVLELQIQTVLDVEVELGWAQERAENKDEASALMQWCSDQLPENAVELTGEEGDATDVYIFNNEQLDAIQRLTGIDLRQRAQDEFEHGVDEGYLIVAERTRQEKEG